MDLWDMIWSVNISYDCVDFFPWIFPFKLPFVDDFPIINDRNINKHIFEWNHFKMIYLLSVVILYSPSYQQLVCQGEPHVPRSKSSGALRPSSAKRPSTTTLPSALGMWIWPLRTRISPVNIRTSSQNTAKNLQKGVE